MILINNINILKNISNDTWEEIKKYEEEKSRGNIVEESRSGKNTLKVKVDNKYVYLHSKYDPEREADTLVENLDIDEESSIIFYGTGLGYHIEKILEDKPNIKYYIYEPIPELLYSFLERVDLSRVKNKNLMGISVGDKIPESLLKFININVKNIKVIELNSHINYYKEEYKLFSRNLADIIKNKKMGIRTNYAFQKRWIVNSLKNFKELLDTPNIILEKKNKFKNKPAILVAAGPSLNEEIENLRYIREKGLAYIFSVGSAINTLIENNIHPHAATTYDPTEKNQVVFEKVKERGIKDIPIIFGSSVGYETLENYPGDKYHMITSQDSIGNFYLKSLKGDISIVQDAPSIAVVTLQLLAYMGFSKIYLVGQNFAYVGNKNHSEGVDYSKEIKEEELKKALRVKNVYGEEVLTNEGYNSMRNQMEAYIKVIDTIEVINTTKGGAHIEGTVFRELKDCVDEYLEENIVEDDWLNIENASYDKVYLELQKRKMKVAYNNLRKINRDYKIIIRKIEKALVNKNLNQIDKLYPKLDEILKKIKYNDFYRVFILQMNRTEYQMLADLATNLNEKGDPLEKANEVVKHFTNFIILCEKDIDMIDEIYREMNQAIDDYIGNGEV